VTWTPEDITALFALFEGAGLRPPPQLATDTGFDTAVRVWMVALDGVPLAAVHGALGLHLRSPERGRWWPVPADLIGHIPQAHALAVVPAMDPDEQAWERILAVLRKGPHAPEAQAAVEFREVTAEEEIRRWDHATQAMVSAGRQTVTRTEVIRTPSRFEQGLTADQANALRQLGGLGGICRAEAEGDAGIARATMRKRFLALCRNPGAVAIEAAPVPALPEGAPAFLRLAFSSGDPQVEAERARTLAAVRGDR
jgi:hypothetical protein